MNFNIGLVALRASQFAIDTVSQNLANANTAGYHRQRVEFQTAIPQYVGGQYLGAGVDIGSVDRFRSQVVESSLTTSISDLSNVTQRLSVETQIEGLFQSGDGSIHNALGGFFDEISRLSANPSELVQRSAVVRQGNDIATQTRDISDQLVGIKDSVRQEIDIQVNQLNGEIKQLVELQNQIKTQLANGTPNDLYDQRDQLVNKIAEKIDIQRFEHVQDGFGLSIAGSTISLGITPIAFETKIQDDGSVGFVVEGTERDIKFASGSIVALSDLHNNTLTEFQGRINDFASDLIRNVDQAHAKGVGTSGPYSLLRSLRSVDSTTAPLNEAGASFPIEEGELYISLTDPNGNKRTIQVPIDPAVDSLEDLAANISAHDNIQAVVDEQVGVITIISAPGYNFDFTGNLETTPDLTNFTGTSVPEISGRYEGNVNRNLSVTVIGNGTISETAGLTAQVTDELTGKVIAEVEIGEGYEAGKPIELIEGVYVSFEVGDVVDGDTFTTALVAESDSTGILSALGINSFFEGDDASDIAVSERIRENPDELATSRSGDISDTFNLIGILELRDLNIARDGAMTLEDSISDTTSEIGFQVQSSSFLQISISEINYQHQTELAAISGVDLNEEMINLAQYQKSYEAAVQVMRTMETMLDELFTMVR